MSTIILKKSSVAGKVPVVGDLAFGELALNYTDGKLYYKTAGNLIDYIANGGTFTTALSITSSTQSTSTTTGALVVTGGVGIGGNLAIGGALYAAGTTGTNGQVLISTGNGISWTTLSSSFNGGTITSPLIINNSTNASSTTTGALQITNGGIGVGGSIFVGGVVTATTFIGNLTGTASTATSAATAFALANTGSTYVGYANLAANATTATNAATAFALANTGSTYVGFANLAANVNTIAQTANATYFLTFVDTNNATAASEPLNSTSSFTINPASGGVRIGGVTTVTDTTQATSTITGAFQVIGGVGIGGSLYVGGTTATFGQGSTQLVINNASGYVTLNAPTGTIALNSFNAQKILIDGNGATVNNTLLAAGTTAASSTNTGALQVRGGVGIGGGLFVGGTITATQITVNGFAVSTGSGGLSSPFSGIFTITNTTSATSTITGALQVAGGVGVGGNIAIGGALYAGGTTGTNGQILTSTGNGISWTTLSSSFNGGTITSPLIINNSTNASSTTTGALQVVGGVGIGGNVNVGGTIVGGGVRSSSTSTAPSNPTVGDIWYDTVNDVVYRYTNDGTTSYWVDLNGPAIISSADTLVTTSGTQTVTNKRITVRVENNGATTSGTITPTADTSDQYEILGLTGAITMVAPSGTPTAGQKLLFRFKDNGTGRGITWTTSSGAYRAIGITLPTTTTASKNTYVGCVYNATDIYWDVVALSQEA